MMVNYWDCEYRGDAKEFWVGKSEFWSYGCKHPDNVDRVCLLKNKFGNAHDDCTLLDETGGCGDG